MDMTSPAGNTASPYHLHEDADCQRLYMQHWLWRMQLGWDLHPAIKLPESSTARIVDQGCGNAYAHCTQAVHTNFSDWCPAHGLFL